MAILEVRNLKKIYTTRFGGNQVQALAELNFSVEKGSMSQLWESPVQEKRRCSICWRR